MGVELSEESTTTGDGDLIQEYHYFIHLLNNASYHEDIDQKSDISWIFLAALSTEANGATMVGKVIDGVNALIKARDFKGIDRALRTVPAGENSSRHVLIALARSTFPVRTKLTSWTRFVRLVESCFADRGLDHARLLKGLL